jgi:hypothetical protein
VPLRARVMTLEHVKIEDEVWEPDLLLAEPKEL